MSEGRVLVLNHFAKPRGSSGGTRHVDIFGRLESWGVQILASNRCYLNPGDKEGSDRTLRAVWTSPYAGAGVLRVLNWATYALGALVMGLRGARPDVVVGSSPHLLAPLAAWVIAKRYRVPFVLEVRDLWPQALVEMGALASGSRCHRVLRRLESWLYQRGDRVVVLTEGVAAELADRGVDEGRIAVIPNGADPMDFRVGMSRAELRGRLGFEGTVFVYAGAHGPANGLNRILDAAEAIGEDHPEARFVLVGDGPTKAELLGAAEERGLSHVRFLDPVSKSSLPDILAAADVGLHVLADVSLFRKGVSPNKVVDYMAAGLPVLTNCPGVVGDVVLDAKAGEVVEPCELEKGIRALLSRTDEGRRRLGTAGREYVGLQRSPRQLARQLERLLEEVKLDSS